MAKPEWGTKRRCSHCGAAFYDLAKDPIVCPKCGTTHHPEALLKPRRGKPEEKVPVVAAKKPGPKKPVDDDEIVEEIGEDEELIEDAAELGEDEDDVAEVIETPEDKEPEV